ncbi:MAG: 5-formyltetrahydrofolate cyclo-ligase [Phycisphaerae bacterium]
MKKQLRGRFRELLKSLPAGQIGQRSISAAEMLRECPEYHRARTVFVFLSMPAEIDTTELITRAWADGKRMLAPKMDWERRELRAIEIHSLTKGLVKTKFGIREPDSAVPVAVAEIDLAIIPGLALDKMGNRLGRGGGLYDRFLADADFHGVACALALDEQVIDTVPIEAHDRAVHLLVTDKRVLRFP